jgi:two-component system, chemotaxis family, sensor histidine kinase and response regulator PixL
MLMNDSQIQIQAYSYFLAEAPELLQTIEQEILSLPTEHTTAKVHSLMRALHTLKGAAANVGLSTIERIAHDLEDVTRVFYDLDLEIDISIQTLLLDGYAGLDECLNAQITDRKIDELAILDRLAEVLAQLKLKLGDWADADIALPTSIELGFDIVASIFETTIQEQIDEVVMAMATREPSQIETCLQSVSDICISLAESFELPGFLAINQAIVAALSHHPDRIEEIAAIALANLQQAQLDVLAGDRVLGGKMSTELANLAPNVTISVENVTLEPIASDLADLSASLTLENTTDLFDLTANGEDELLAFQSFLISDNFRKRHEFSADNKHLFDRIIRLCWDWFRQEIQTSETQLDLEILVTSEGIADLDYIHHWIGLLLQSLDPDRQYATSYNHQRSSLHLYRQCCIYQVVFAVAKYLAGTEPHPQFTAEFLTELRLHLQITADTYKQGSPVTANERGWIDRIILPHHWSKISPISVGEDLLLNQIWGQPDFGNS